MLTDEEVDRIADKVAGRLIKTECQSATACLKEIAEGIAGGSLTELFYIQQMAEQAIKKMEGGK